MILLGGPIDTRISPTAVNRLAQEKGIDWFRQNVVTVVPWPHPGRGRRVYPGFLQLTGFISMNMDRHVNAHRELFFNLIKGDGDSAEKHREFYDEYLAVMDLAAEYYLQTVEQVFIQHALPKGRMRYRDNLIDPAAVTRVALMTVEGEKDDITGIGQCEAAHRLCSSLPKSMRGHHLQPGAGHYGIFNGSRFRSDIVPAIGAFVLRHDLRGGGLMTRLLRYLRSARGIEAAVPPIPEIDAPAPGSQPVATAAVPLRLAANSPIPLLRPVSYASPAKTVKRLGLPR
jgi:poly(3-hydroxybutyrate) depolymerase